MKTNNIETRYHRNPVNIMLALLLVCLTAGAATDKNSNKGDYVGWRSIHAEFITVDADDHEVLMDKSCQVAGLGGAARRDGTYEYSGHEKIRFDDGKAVGPFIRSALEIETMGTWLPKTEAARKAMFKLE